MNRPEKVPSKGRPKVRQAIRRALGKDESVEVRPKEWRTYAAPFFMMPLRWRTAAPAQAAGHHATPSEVPAEERESAGKRRTS
jgi:hypothetical protein